MAGDRHRDRAGKVGARLVDRPELAGRVAERARRRAARHRRRLAEAFEPLQTLVRLVRAWASGRSRQVPVRTLAAVLGALVYFLLPLDTLPDFVAILGFLDDAAVIAHVARRFRKDLVAFQAWEKEQGIGAPAIPAARDAGDENDDDNEPGGPADGRRQR